MQNHFARFVEDESGATAIEYALLGSLIAVFLIGAMNTFATNLTRLFGNVSAKL